jgi:predicted PurR-regulated permease PerM
LGVFISTTPIVLVALNTGGPPLSLAAIGMVVIIHAFEAYLLNPMIYGRHLRLNPVLTLIILYVGYHIFGLWGMLLGVPVARYFIHDVLGVPFKERALPGEQPAT